jgi:hypothetical protein
MMWDSALLMYQFDNASQAHDEFEANVTKIQTNFPPEKQSDHANTSDPFVMNMDAYNISRECAYGRIGDEALKSDSIPINDTYLVPNRREADRLLSLGGYRLGLILQKVLKPPTPTPTSSSTPRPTPTSSSPPRPTPATSVGGREIAAWTIDSILMVVVVIYIVFGVKDHLAVTKSEGTPMIAPLVR